MNPELKVVTDPNVFQQLSSAQRVLTVLRIAGHTDAQIANLTRPHSHTGVMVNNLATCRDPKLQAECLKHKAACEAELMANLPSDDDRRWSVFEELEIILAVAGDSVVPERLRRVFATINNLQANPV